ncbi:hypothetical protein APHAL10511_000972 [Amanita phalloides]|nr:hypothetical protein APHAL10511_000972 [Amanita phalloides]
MTPQALALTSILIACILVALVFLFNRKSSQKGDALLIVGPSGAGKTAIWSSLAYDETPLTHTSLQTNSAVYQFAKSNKAIRIIDVPGHPRLRDQFRNYLTDARAVAFVVDANSISRSGAAVAEHLHHVLHAITSLSPPQSPPLLILVHKVDLLKTLSSAPGHAADLVITRVKTILERELEKRRAVQSNSVGVEGLGEEGEGFELGGLDCGENAANAFKFDEWEGGEITFLATWLHIQAPVSEKGEAGLASLTDWLEEFCNHTR